MVVSVGSALSPGRYVKVLLGGSVQFTSASSSEKWRSSQNEIASIDQYSGLAKAFKVGQTEISHG
jgi:hypothetical protein